MGWREKGQGQALQEKHWVVIPRPGFQSGGIQAPLAAQSHEQNRSGREHNPCAVPYDGPTQHAFWQTHSFNIFSVYTGAT